MLTLKCTGQRVWPIGQNLAYVCFWPVEIPISKLMKSTRLQSSFLWLFVQIQKCFFPPCIPAGNTRTPPIKNGLNSHLTSFFLLRISIFLCFTCPAAKLFVHMLEQGHVFNRAGPRSPCGMHALQRILFDSQLMQNFILFLIYRTPTAAPLIYKELCIWRRWWLNSSTSIQHPELLSINGSKQLYHPMGREQKIDISIYNNTPPSC